jgi:D-alanyl-D-alanine carboxypeptidase
MKSNKRAVNSRTGSAENGRTGNSVRKARSGFNRQLMLIILIICVIAVVGIISLAAHLNDATSGTDQITQSQEHSNSQETEPSAGQSTSTEATDSTTVGTTTAEEPTDTVKPPESTTALPTEETTASATQAPTTENQNEIVKYNGFSDPRSIEPEPALKLGEFTALVNKYFVLSSDYEPELIAVPGTPYFLHPAVLDPWLQMQSDCSEATGVKVYMTSGYRSFSVQEYTFNDAINRKGIALTVPYNALAGRSEHQLGLAVDVNDGVYKKYSTSFSQTATYAWLNQHAHEYGFILRYPKGKESITDYAYEPWHYRYVGKEAAAEIQSRGIVLEEFHGV